VFYDDLTICGGAGDLFSVSFEDLNPDRTTTVMAATVWNFEVAEIEFVRANKDYFRISDALLN
jgi:hypothetical protein